MKADSAVAERQARADKRSVRFEPSDVPSFLPLWLAVGLAGFVILVFVSISVAFPLARHQQYRGPLQPLPPTPRLQVSPEQDLKTYQAKKSEELRSSALPIEAAMEATARQGWGPPR